MAKRQKVWRERQQEGSYKRLFYYATLLAWGFVPSQTASVKQLAEMLKKTLIQISIKQGQWNMDPEVPDNPLAIIMPAMMSRGVPKNDIMNVLSVAESGENGMAGVVNEDGSIATVEDAAAANDSWATNTAEWWEDTWSGDWASGWTNFQQGWNDFWSGNF